MRNKNRHWLLICLWGLSACAHLPPLISARDPLSASEHKTLGDTYLAQGDKKLAGEQYRAALAADHRMASALLALGNLAFEEKNWSKAGSYFRRALKLEPEDPAARNNVAMVYVAQGKHLNKAKKLVTAAIPTAGPLAPYLLDTLALIALQEGRFSDAKTGLDLAEAAAPANDPEFRKHIQESRQKLLEAAQAAHNPRNGTNLF